MYGRVRKNTSGKINSKIDKEGRDNIWYYSSLDKSAIKAGIEDLGKEWDIERVTGIKRLITCADWGGFRVNS